MFYKCKQYAYRRMQLHVSQTGIALYVHVYPINAILGTQAIHYIHYDIHICYK